MPIGVNQNSVIGTLLQRANALMPPGITLAVRGPVVEKIGGEGDGMRVCAVADLLDKARRVGVPGCVSWLGEKARRV